MLLRETLSRTIPQATYSDPGWLHSFCEVSLQTLRADFNGIHLSNGCKSFVCSNMCMHTWCVPAYLLKACSSQGRLLPQRPCWLGMWDPWGPSVRGLHHQRWGVAVQLV